jgi:leucyl/phenylalanyl-tRNA--protein transferase
VTALVPTRPPPIEPPASRFLFPDARRGVGPHGVVCVGGDFAPGTLLSAYRRGIFPWPVSGELVPWCSPDPRAILPLDEPPRWSRSLRRTLRRGVFRVTVDVAFEEVMDGCGDRDEGTWITPALAAGYRELHALGWAHSVEVWNAASGELVGGIYGLAIGAMFAGESMFHRETDASKVAFASLAERLFAAGYRFLDAQQMTPHLASLGCIDVPRPDLLRKLRAALVEERSFPVDPPSR